MSVGGAPVREDEPLGSTRAAAIAFEPRAIASLCGGLQLLPSNIHRLWRLQALAALCSAAPPGSERRREPSVGNLTQLLNEGALGARADQYEDAFDDVVAEEIAFHHGSFLVSTGLAEDGVAGLRTLIKITLLSTLLPDELRKELTRSAAAALHLSDHVLRGAGLHRNGAPPERTAGASIPGASTARRLAALVTFSEEELREASGTGDLSTLEPFITPQELGRFTSEQIVEGHTSRWPMRRYADTFVLAEPFSIALALREHLAFTALDAVGPDALAQVFGFAIDDDADDVLHHIGERATDRSVTRRSSSTPWTETVMRIDRGLQLRTLVVADGFTGLDRDNPYAFWDRDHALNEAHEHLEAAAAATSEEVLGVVIAATAGGSAVLGTPESALPNLRTLVVGLSDLGAITFLESGDPVALWKFERAKDLISGRLMSWGALDLYGVYRSEERSLAPLAGATFVSIAPGSGTERRVEYKTIRDFHGARFVDGTVREVRRTEPDEKQSPIYTPVDLGDRQLLYVAGVGLDAWVVGPPEEVLETWSHVNSVAYWLNQLAAWLPGLFERIASRLSCMAIKVIIAEPAVWSGRAKDPGGGEPFTWELDGNTASLCLGLPVARKLSNPDNEADRLILEAIAAAVDALAREHGLPGVPQEATDAAIEHAAPPGLKKHLIGMPHEGNELAEEAELSPRLVQEADVSRARELLADHLKKFGWHGETVPHDRRDELLKDAVSFLFGQACALLDETSPAGLLDALMLENERLVAHTELRQAFLSARLETEPESANEIRTEVAKAAQAAIACRFLIEYVVACPPDGQAEWSLRRYDECLALVAELLDWAYLDDAVNAGLSATDLLIRDDGQLRLLELGRYERGQSSFFDRVVEDLKAASASIFSERLATRDPDAESRDPNETLTRLDDALASETGLTSEGLVNLFHAAAHLTREANAEFLTMPRSDAVAALAATTGGEPSTIERAVDYFTLGPRDSLLRPTSGSTRDVLPSRSARRWSYVRRPFALVDTTEGPTLTWGRRHPVAALRVFIGQLLSGSYQHLAEGKDLLSALGTVGSESGHDFENRVGQVFESVGIDTIIGCESVGNDSLHKSDHGDLGDIDVLACDRQRRTIWVVECKDLTGAITTSDFVDEMTEHFGSGDATTLSRVSARVAWIDARKLSVLTEFTEPSSAREWSTRGLIVTSVPVIAPFITDSPFPIVTIGDLGPWLTRSARSSKSKSRQRGRKKR